MSRSSHVCLYPIYMYDISTSATIICRYIQGLSIKLKYLKTSKMIVTWQKWVFFKHKCDTCVKLHYDHFYTTWGFLEELLKESPVSFLHESCPLQGVCYYFPCRSFLIQCNRLFHTMYQALNGVWLNQLPRSTIIKLNIVYEANPLLNDDKMYKTWKVMLFNKTAKYM